MIEKHNCLQEELMEFVAKTNISFKFENKLIIFYQAMRILKDLL